MAALSNRLLRWVDRSMSTRAAPAVVAWGLAFLVPVQLFLWLAMPSSEFVTSIVSQPDFPGSDVVSAVSALFSVALLAFFFIAIAECGKFHRAGTQRSSPWIALAVGGLQITIALELLRRLAPDWWIQSLSFLRLVQLGTVRLDFVSANPLPGPPALPYGSTLFVSLVCVGVLRAGRRKLHQASRADPDAVTPRSAAGSSPRRSRRNLALGLMALAWLLAAATPRAVLSWLLRDRFAYAVDLVSSPFQTAPTQWSHVPELFAAAAVAVLAVMIAEAGKLLLVPATGDSRVVHALACGLQVGLLVDVLRRLVPDWYSFLLYFLGRLDRLPVYPAPDPGPLPAPWTSFVLLLVLAGLVTTSWGADAQSNRHGSRVPVRPSINSLDPVDSTTAGASRELSGSSQRLLVEIAALTVLLSYVWFAEIEPRGLSAARGKSAQLLRLEALPCSAGTHAHEQAWGRTGWSKFCAVRDGRPEGPWRGRIVHRLEVRGQFEAGAPAGRWEWRSAAGHILSTKEYIRDSP